MKHKWIVAVAIIILVVVLVGVFSGLFNDMFHLTLLNNKPSVVINYPTDGASVYSLVMISGTASDPDTDDAVDSVEVCIDDGDWMPVEGTTLWSSQWNTISSADGSHTVAARAYDGTDYSPVVSISVTVRNQVDSQSHRYALFVVAANFPQKNETKLGNGGLNLAEDIASYFIDHASYAASRVVILFDDGWIRADNGYGERVQTLQERPHDYAITYGPATKDSFLMFLNQMIDESNKYDDSEMFLWMFNHGCGDSNKPITGGKILQSSEIFLWDGTMTDKELGDALAPLQSDKVTVFIDACYAGGFADRLIFNLKTSLLLRSGIPGNGRVVISATSKFRAGYASTTQGPLFTLLWFQGLSTGDADGFKAGLFDRGKPTTLKLFKDGQVSVEEAFYYAKYTLRTDDAFDDYDSMQPQINDQYPHRGLLRSMGGLVLGLE